MAAAAKRRHTAVHYKEADNRNTGFHRDVISTACYHNSKISFSNWKNRFDILTSWCFVVFLTLSPHNINGGTSLNYIHEHVDVLLSVYPYFYSYNCHYVFLPFPEATRSKARICGRSLAGNAGSNPAGGMDVCLL